MAKTGRPRTPVLDRIADLIDFSDECWLWTGELAGPKRNRPRIRIAGRTGKRVNVHRLLYQLVVEPVPAELDLDHLCMDTRCVNPDHLEPVTRGENVRRWYRAQSEER